MSRRARNSAPSTSKKTRRKTGWHPRLIFQRSTHSTPIDKREPLSYTHSSFPPIFLWGSRLCPSYLSSKKSSQVTKNVFFLNVSTQPIMVNIFLVGRKKTQLQTQDLGNIKHFQIANAHRSKQAHESTVNAPNSNIMLDTHFFTRTLWAWHLCRMCRISTEHCHFLRRIV